MLAPHPDRDTLVATVTAIEKKACADADRIICVSDEDREAFEASGHCEIAVIQNGVDMPIGSATLICRPSRVSSRAERSPCFSAAATSRTSKRWNSSCASLPRPTSASCS